MSAQSEIIASYQRRVRQATTEMLRARHIGCSEAAIERVMNGGEVVSPNPLVPLTLALASMSEGEDRLREEGLSDATIAKISDDAAQVIREEWTYGISADDLVPLPGGQS